MIHRVLTFVADLIFGRPKQRKYEWPREEPRSIGGLLRDRTESGEHEVSRKMPRVRGPSTARRLAPHVLKFRRYAKRDEQLQNQRHARPKRRTG